MPLVPTVSLLVAVAVPAANPVAATPAAAATPAGTVPDKTPAPSGTSKTGRTLLVCIGSDTALMVDLAALRAVRAATNLQFRRLIDATAGGAIPWRRIQRATPTAANTWAEVEHLIGAMRHVHQTLGLTR